MRRLGKVAASLSFAFLVSLACLACQRGVAPPTTTATLQPTQVPSSHATLTPISSPTLTNTSSPSATPSPTPTPSLPPRAPLVYTVQAGDTLIAIAQKFDISLQELMEANDIAYPHLIRVGQKLTIPGEISVTPTASPPSPEGTPLGALPSFGAITFGMKIGPNNRPTKPSTRFSPGPNRRIYACFRFENMAKSKNWTRVWYRDGKEFIRETDIWRWGNSGNAWLYRTGWQSGKYELRLFIDGKLQQKASFVVK